jgi:arabinofuranan 3-O-arabinosyltransferase
MTAPEPDESSAAPVPVRRTRPRPRPRRGLRPRSRPRPALGSILLAIVAYVPLLLTRPGEVGADTKTYLYLDPARLLSRAVWMWDTNIGLGTVTHQNIGYLWPMGPWYWAFDTLGVPDWVAQRLWLGSLVFAAGMGVRFMLRELRWAGPGLTVASFSYALSPYLLHYGARISVILLPFAGLPWLVGLASRSLRRGGWRWPAVFALVTLTVGGVNATSLLLVMAGPLLWFVHATFVAREVTLRRALAVGARISVLTLATSLWWMAGLSVQGAFGIPILRYTETYHTVATAALATEIVRGLGYWFFYGRDALGGWISAAQRLVESIPSLALSFALPGMALVSGLLTRFRHRGYFALLVAVGVLLGVGAHPWDSSAPAGALFKAWTRTDSGLAFRSTPRAVPLVALGLAVMLAAGVAALSAARPSWHAPAAGTLVVLICCNMWGWFGGEMVDRNLRRDEQVPGYWLGAAAAIDAGSRDTRAYEMPGTDFASYRWGNTVDPITPGLIDRPYAARELIPYGTASSADLLNAWDLPLQEGSFDPASVVPVAQLLGVGTVVHRGDLQYERFRTPRPRDVWWQLGRTDGIAPPRTFGDGFVNEATDALPLDDEVELGTPAGRPDPPAVSLWDLEDPRPVLRTVDAASPTLMAGDGAGIVAWARTGALDPDRPILQSASYAEDPDGLDAQLEQPEAQLVVTDTNRRQARRWGSVRENDGYTERAGEVALERDPADNRLDEFPGAGDDAYTVVEQVGGATVAASAYGNPVSYTPADRAALAMDGDPSTAWSVAAFDEPRGEYLEIRTDDPATTDRFTLLQHPGGNRWITEVEVTLDDGDPRRVALGDQSRSGEGQVVDLGGERTFSRLRITITEANVTRQPRYIGFSGVGINEVTIPGVDPVVEVVRPPTDLLDASGAGSIDHPLTYVFTRRHANPAEVVVGDEEPAMRRWVEGPVARSFTVAGTARAASRITGAEVDRIIGMPPPEEGGLEVTESAYLAGALRSRGTAAVDGDPTTAWQTPINGSVGQWVRVRADAPVSVDRLALEVLSDGRHSVPTRLGVQADDGTVTSVEVPAVGTGPREVDGRPARGRTVAVDVPLPAAMTGTAFTVTVEAIEEARSKDWFTGDPTVLPVGIAELGLGPTAAVPADGAELASSCRSDLLTVGGSAVGLRPGGTVGDFLDGSLLPLSPCGDPVDLPPGRTLLETTDGEEAGLAVDQLALTSDAGGAPGPDTWTTGPTPVADPPETATDNTARLTWTVEVTGATDPYWVVLGQSLSPGFTATTADGTDLGEPTLVNGYANGWLVDPDEVGADATITITWSPQRLVWLGLWLSALGVLACVALVVRPVRFGGGVALEGPPEEVTVSAVAPLRPEGTTLGTARALGVGAACGVAAWLLGGWAVGLAVAVLVAAALRLRRGQVALRLAGAGLFAAAAGYVVAKQWRSGYVLDFNWPTLFEATHAWTLTAVALLAVDPLVTALRRPPGDRAPEPGREDGAEGAPGGRPDEPGASAPEGGDVQSSG